MSLNMTQRNIASIAEVHPTGMDLFEMTAPPGDLTTSTPMDIPCEWASTTEYLQSAFDIHVYGYAGVYILTGIVSVIRLYRLYTFRAGRLMSGFHVKLNMHISTLIFSLLRTVMLCLDPYGFKCRVPPLLIRLLMSMAFPCLAVAFNLLLLLLLETTKLYPNLSCIKHQTLTLVGSAGVYSLVLILKDLLLDYDAISAIIFDIFALIIYTIWGVIMMIGYFFVAWKIRSSLRNSGSPVESEALRRFSGLLQACGMVGLFTLMTQILYAICKYGLPKPFITKNPWVWWCLQSALFMFESVMSCLLMVVASRTDNKRHVNVAPCTNWEWPRMHGWNLEAVPTRPGRPVPAGLNVKKNSPVHPTQSTNTRQDGCTPHV
ncbi:uncharacterized protein [Asterias amurensis]|uniref:uncharacterized protein n=1 Tax=Asterias amurensis TaxID=7602 RepID=UPI003AB5CCEA